MCGCAALVPTASRVLLLLPVVVVVVVVAAAACAELGIVASHCIAYHPALMQA